MSKRRKYVDASELSTLKMTCGNEKKYSVVIDTSLVKKRWVGFGWVDEGEPSSSDLKKYPVVRRPK